MIFSPGLPPILHLELSNDDAGYQLRYYSQTTQRLGCQHQRPKPPPYFCFTVPKCVAFWNASLQRHHIPWLRPPRQRSLRGALCPCATRVSFPYCGDSRAASSAPQAATLAFFRVPRRTPLCKPFLGRSVGPDRQYGFPRRLAVPDVSAGAPAAAHAACASGPVVIPAKVACPALSVLRSHLLLRQIISGLLGLYFTNSCVGVSACPAFPCAGRTHT